MTSRRTRSVLSIALLTTLSASLLSTVPVAANAAPGGTAENAASEPRKALPQRITKVARVELRERPKGKPTKVAAPVLSQSSTETSSSSPDRASGPQASVLAPTSTFVVNYSGFTAEQQASYQSAIDVLKTLIVAPQPIVINASFASLPPGVVGSAGPTYLQPLPDNSVQGHTFYPAALANQKTNSDTDPAQADVQTQFGTAFNSQWYFGTGTVPSNLIDFKSVVMHEVWHGLGFLGSMDVRSGLGSWGFGTPIPAVYDRHTTNTAGVPLLDGSAFPKGSAALAGQLTGGALQFVGANTRRSNGGANPRLYAPSTWEPGSSYAHLNEATFPAGNANSLLTPSIAAGETIHSPGPISLGIFRDMGWNTKIVPAATVAPTATAGVGSVTVSWTAPDNGGDTISSYVVRPSNGGAPMTVSGNVTSTTFSGLAAGTPVSFTVVAANGIGSSPTSSSSAAVTPTSDGTTVVPVGPAGSKLVPLAPVRVLDTRVGTGSRVGAVTGGESIDVQVTGLLGVPSTGVTAVVLNVIAVAPSNTSFVTAYPTGPSRPLASSLNPTAGITAPNMVVVKVGAGGKVSLFNSDGSTQLVADIAGYYTDTGAGSTFAPLAPARVLDTRDGTGSRVGAVTGGESIDVQVTGLLGVPSTGVTAVMLNVIAVAPSNTSFVTAYPTGPSRPLASSLNPTAGITAPNMVLVKVGAGGKVSLFNSDGSTQLVADIAGYFTDAGAGSVFQPLTPSRVLDTRDGTGSRVGAVTGGESINVQVTGLLGVPSTGVTAVVLNVIAVAPSSTSFVTGYPTGPTRPLASSLNPTAGITAPNMVVVKVGAGGKVSLFNSAGNTQFVADVAGYYTS